MSALTESFATDAGAELMRPDMLTRALTQREQELLAMAGAGMTNKEIASKAGISVNTVKTHLHRASVKLQQSGRYKAYLAQRGLGEG